MTAGKRTIHLAAGIAMCLAASLALGACSIRQEGGQEAQKESAPVYYPSDLPYPFSDAVQVGNVLYLSGDIGDSGDGKTLVPGGVEAETRRIFERLGQRLAKHDLTYADVFKCTVMLADMADWPAFNAIYAEYFKEGRYPARSAMGVNGLALGARVELECWAYKG